MGARLGQHFLKNPTIARALVDACHIRREEIVVEIGPGEGALTRELLAAGGRVVAIEKDEALVKSLQTTFDTEIRSGSLTVHEGDVRDISIESLGLTKSDYVLAANIPYYITGEILRLFLSTASQPRTAALLIQKEVAQRIVAQRESILSLSVKVYGSPRIERYVPAGNFSPPPKVDSAILVIEDISRKNFESSAHEQDFFALVKRGFSSRRKMLINNLEPYGKAKALSVLQEVAVPEKSRAEDLPLNTWLSLSKKLRVSDLE
ncbi:MAG: dimethyladenosine transferase, rRNA (adenine1518-N6/adenine1519-N6)-dimethyltransferase [Candidatus Parcubacteria bacterium]|jgi:16S rRNA (adenine1518-N6/adenine1519-N6)-dimethyltransferase